MADPTAGPGLDAGDLNGRGVVVAGGGTAGLSAASYLLDVGARVTIADDRFVDEPGPGPASARHRGAVLRPVTDLLDDPRWTDDTDLVIASPGFAPTHALPVAAATAGLPVWGEVELAWRVDRAGLLGEPRTWLVVTGTNGKTTTTAMLADIVERSGHVPAACGNIGMPVLDAMQARPRVDVLCAELSSFQLFWAPSVAPDAGVVLNIADDHLDWHGSFDAYAAAKQIALHGTVGVVGLDDAVASRLPVTGRRVGFTLGAPAAGQLGVVDDELTDRAFADHPRALGVASAVRPAGPPGISDALGAAALALSIGVAPDDVAGALVGFAPAAHRGEVVATRDGIDFVDDSKATNPHAAQAAIAARGRVVLVAGGLLKGASLDSMLDAVGDRIAGVVAIGRDRDLVVDAISRHAPKVPAVTVFTGDDGSVTVQHAAPTPATAVVDRRDTVTGDPAVAVMTSAVDAAWAMTTTLDPRPDTVLLAPAAASLDMFAGYGDRGDAFAAAARQIADATDQHA